ncbi:cytochrome P450 [Venturia nashicola]|uniref:Cytochrome P450 n=1 Tax=Venturia nashicola TaxID=86259 RepID=A0A4Z1PC51_9PEZI|nr:cytochrome P450 [Venturia nashicola]
MTLMTTLWNALPSSVLGGISLAVFSFSTFVLGVIVYRLTLHPLAKYPGPFLAKITDIYLAYHAWKGDRHLELWRCHEKYGPYVRMGPNTLSLNTNTALKTIYGFNANVRKADFYSAFPVNKNTFNVHSSIDKVAHARKRRVLSHAFSDKAIKSMEKYVLEKVRTFCRALPTTDLDLIDVQKSNGEKDWGSPKNMGEYSDWLAFDVMGELAFGKSFDMIERPDNRFASTLLGNAAHRHLICGTHLTLHHYHLDKVLFPKIAGSRAQYMNYSRQQCMERTKVGLDADRRDFFYHLLTAKDETAAGFSMNELWGESNLLIIAGSDTTSTALAATFFYLLHNPGTLQRATAEVRSSFNDVEEIVHGSILASCHYLRACIDEAMRLSPPVGGGLPRQVLQGGLTIDSHVIPAGIDVYVPHYTIHHNSDYFPAPFSYNPSRWLPESARQAEIDLAHSAFCPFSVGPRGCIGKGMAYIEMMETLARVMWLFDMRLAPGREDVGAGAAGHEEGRRRAGEYQLKDTFTSMKDGPIVQFRARA